MPWWNWWSAAERKLDGAHNISTVDNVVNTSDTRAEYQPASPASSTVNAFWVNFRQPETLVATALLTTACLGIFKFYRSYLKRIPQATDIRQSYFRRRSVLGKVTSVGDGDNFRIYHTPGGWLAGWGWIPWRRVPSDRKLLKNNTIHIRIAGIDAPEAAHFGRPAQPYSKEALEWLTSYVIGRRVRAHLHRADQYSRVVATAYVWRRFVRRDVGLQMLRAGLATVYEAKTGAEFGDGLEQKYRDAEKWAKVKRKGMWAGNMKEYESPRQYKTKYQNEDTSQKSG